MWRTQRQQKDGEPSPGAAKVGSGANCKAAGDAVRVGSSWLRVQGFMLVPSGVVLA